MIPHIVKQVMVYVRCYCNHSSILNEGARQELVSSLKYLTKLAILTSDNLLREKKNCRALLITIFNIQVQGSSGA